MLNSIPLAKQVRTSSLLHVAENSRPKTLEIYTLLARRVLQTKSFEFRPQICRCLWKNRPSRLNQAQAAMLCNLAELVIRILESAVLENEPTNPLLGEGQRRGISFGQQAYAFVDTSKPGWGIVFETPAFKEATSKFALDENLPTYHSRERLIPCVWCLKPSSLRRAPFLGLHQDCFGPPDRNKGISREGIATTATDVTQTE